jgi:tetratricopeptide (TPR) repeat protein
VLSQQSETDSLLQLTKSGAHDTTRLSAFILLSEICSEEEILKYASPALNLAEKLAKSSNPALSLSGKKSMAAALNNIGYYYSLVGENKTAVKNYQESLHLCEETGNKKGTALAYNNIASIFQSEGKDKEAMEYYSRSLSIRKEIKDTSGMSEVMGNIGVIYFYAGNMQKALEFYNSALQLDRRRNDVKGIGFWLFNMANVYEKTGDIVKALEYFHESLRYTEKGGEKIEIAGRLNALGLLYYKIGDLQKAEENFKSALALYQKSSVRDGLPALLNNLGLLFYARREFDKAEEYYQKSLDLTIELDKPRQTAGELINLGMVCSERGDFKKSMEYYQKSLKICNELNDKAHRSYAMQCLGRDYARMHKYREAERCYLESLKGARDLGFPEQIMTPAQGLYRIYKEEKKDTKALEMYQLFIQMRDSVMNDQVRKSAIQQELKYTFEKKEAIAWEAHQIALKRSEREKQKQKMVLILLSVIAFLVLAVSATIIVALRRIKIQKREIEQQKEILDSKQKDLLDSIFYARRIQQSLLPNEMAFKKGLRMLSVIFIFLLVAHNKAIAQPDLPEALNNSAREYYQKGNLKQAETDALKALAFGTEAHQTENIRDAEQTLYSVYRKMGKDQEALKHYEQYIAFSDSLNNQRARKISLKKQLQFDYDKKQALSKAQKEKELENARTERQRQNILIGFITAIAAGLLIIAVVVFRSLKTNRLQKKILEEQKQLVEEKQKEILDSIHYAKRIQKSLLPTEKFLERILGSRM